MTAEEFFYSQSPTDANNCVVNVYARKYDRSELIRFADAYHKAKINEIMDKIKFTKLNKK